MNKALIFIFLSGLSLAGGSTVNSLSQPKYAPVIKSTKQMEKYKVFDDKALPILGYAFIPGHNCEGAENPSYVNRTNFMLYKEAGFTIAASLYDRFEFKTSEVYNSLRICDEIGMKYLVAEPAFLDRNPKAKAATVEEYKAILKAHDVSEYDSFCGFALMDEPPYPKFEMLGRGQEAIKSMFPRAVGFATLYPCGASAYTQFQIPDVDPVSAATDNMVNFTKYAQYYVDMTKPQVLAYDHYMFHDKTGTQILQSIDTINFFKNMNIVKRLADEQDIPYWCSVSSYRHITKKQHSFKETEWQSNMSLAFGAQGLQYYTYWPTIEGKTEEELNEVKYLALTTGNGIPNDNYYRIKEFNAFLHSIEHVIMQGQQLGMLQYGNATSVIPEENKYNDETLLTGVRGNGSIAVGRFDYQNRPAYYIINDSVTDSIQPYVAKFSEKHNFKVTTYSGVSYYDNVQAIGLSLYGGQAAMVEVLD